MVFSSLTFLYLFLAAVMTVGLVLPRSWRNAWLLAASLLFYIWGETWYVFVMIGTILANWAFGLVMAAREDEGWRKKVMVVGVVANLALLVVFKYTNFICANVVAAAHGLGWTPVPTWNPGVHLPIGISFFSFQAISYVVDVYRREVPPSRSLIDYAMYKSFFPQLIAGPIVRYRDVADQVKHRVVTPDLFASGVDRFVLGMAKKVLIANIVAAPADAVFNLPVADLTTAEAWFGAVCYAVQIYCDFSGYSDMAIGLGRMFGFTFLENFNLPYVAESVRDFWRRWHISLSGWFRDYLYIPLGGNRVAPWRAGFNLFAVFTLCGLWHGAAWTYVLWGLYHGIFLAAEHFGLGKPIAKLWRPLRHAYALVAVLIGWVLFRATTLEGAGHHLAAMAGFSAPGATGLGVDWPTICTGEVATALGAGFLACAGFGPWFAARFDGMRRTGSGETAFQVARILVLALLMVAATMQLDALANNPFIYFQF